MEQIIKISVFVIESFIHIWPYLIITIPLAVIVHLSGVAKYINKAFSHNPLVSVLLATIAGAFSSFCSCGVISVIASLLIGGVPLAPVMAFWIASPSMDPEIFFLSVATIAWELSIWRLAATFFISLLAGYLTHIVFLKGLFRNEILRKNKAVSLNKSWRQLSSEFVNLVKQVFVSPEESKNVAVQYLQGDKLKNYYNMNCCISVDELKMQTKPQKQENRKSCNSSEDCKNKPASFSKKMVKESWKATAMVVKFMTLAFFVNVLIQFYVPQEFISDLLGGNNSFSVLIAAFIGVPVYTSNITALPIISGLLTLGMNKGAALAFLISGPTTTLPAMVAVWGIVSRKIFFFYISFALIGAILLGFLYNLMN